MNIGIFQSNLPEPGRKVGGVEYVVHRLANRLVERGHVVTVFTHTPTSPPDALYTLRQVTKLRGAGGRFGRITYGSAALNFIDTTGLDALNLHADDWFFLRRRVATVRAFHGSSLREALAATRWRRRLSMAFSFAGELLSSRLATSSYTVCAGMPPGYRLDGFLPQAVGLQPAVEPEYPGGRTTQPTLLFVGTWSGRKRGEMLFNLFIRQIRPKFPEAELIMVSDYVPEAEGVRWIKYPSDAELSELYARAWLFCSTSSYEGFGHPYVEAMAHGTPVVGTRNVGLDYVSESGAAARVVADDALGEAIEQLLRDGEERKQLADAGVKQAKKFNWEATCTAYEQAFESAVNRYATKPQRREPR